MATVVSKSLVDDLVARGAGDARHVRNMLVALSESCSDALEAGEDFTVPGIVKLKFAYRKPQKKGSRWSKGDTVIGFGGIENVKEEASPAVTAQIKLRPSLTGDAYRARPGSKAADQAAFIKTPAGKNIIKRKG